MSAHSKLFVGLFLSATLSAAALADGDWEILALADGKSPANISGIEGAIWVPNQFNNPTIDENGTVHFRGLIAGPGITNLGASANHIALVKWNGSGWSLVARNNEAVPGGAPAGAIFSRTASPNNSIVSANNISENGGVLVQANIRKDSKLIESLEEIMTELRVTWEQAIRISRTGIAAGE